MGCYKKTVLVLVPVLILSFLLMWFCTTSKTEKEDDFHLVATFYPVYVATLNITEDVPGVSLENLVSSQTGCLHDYQLSPENLITLSTADAWIVNGAGAESFLTEVAERYPTIPVIDSSEKARLLPSGEDDEDEFYNSHMWTSPSVYATQVQTICDGLCSLDEAHASQYRKNTSTYLKKIMEVTKKLKNASENLPTNNVILFHESLSYLANDLGLHVLSVLPIGEEGGVAASDLKEAANAIKDAEDVLLLYDDQYYDLKYEYLANSANRHKSLFLDIAVSKHQTTLDKDAWLLAMEDTASKLSEVSF